MAVLIVVNLYFNLLLHILFWSGMSYLSLVKNRSDPLLCISCCNFCTDWCGILTVIFYIACFFNINIYWLLYFDETCALRKFPPTPFYMPFICQVFKSWQQQATSVNLFYIHFQEPLLWPTFWDCCELYQNFQI